MNAVKAFLAENMAGFSYKIIPHFLFAFFVCVLLSYFLGRIYVRYGRSVSNRASFAGNFILLGLTTMFIISIVKSSLALSLGLVGALSIVRFRAAIKEPEELTYLFLTIAIGLGCGAGFPILTVIAFAGFFLVIRFNSRQENIETGQLLYLTIASSSEVSPGAYMDILKKHCEGIKLKRIDHSGNAMEMSLLVDVSDFEVLQNALSELRNTHPGASISFLDNSRDF